MPWSDYHVSDWNDLVRQFHVPNSLPSFLIQTLYRGQADVAWKLQDSFARQVGSSCDVRRALEIEDNSLRLFQAQAHLYMKAYDLPEDKIATGFLRWWTLMQHFRAPTRLLDWTRSPFVATYFAVVQQWDKPGAVYAFSNKLLLDANLKKHGISFDFSKPDPIDSDFLKPDSNKMLYPFELKKYNLRVAAQQGAFTACGRLLDDHGVRIEEALNGEPGAVTVRFIIKEDLKPEIMRNLALMNITATSLFPGLDGLGQSISEFVNLEKLF